MDFEPIAIVGRACLLPGANGVEQYASNLAAGTDSLREAPDGRWRLSRELALGESGRDCAWSARGGYVENFEFDPSPFSADPDRLRALDPLFQWSLHTAHGALTDAGIEPSERVSVILGNLSFPSEAMTEYGERVWLERNVNAIGAHLGDLDVDRPDPWNRFSSGLPAHLVANSLGLGRAYALDAACATSLYALHLASMQLWTGEADAVLAGAVNRADSLFLHVGFCALNALSPTGQSRPFHRKADGLVPAEGAAFVALKRLSDAARDGDRVLGVLRGIGLSNDGRGRGFLAPSIDGQLRAMRAAYQDTELTPSDVSYVECHATGTSLGDAAELESMSKLWPDGLAIGSHKSNFGHAITVAGLAGMLKVLDVFEHDRIPATLHVDTPIERAADPFRLIAEPESFDGRFAAVNAFGFGGNNAHVVIERPGHDSVIPAPDRPTTPVAVVGLRMRVGDAENTEEVFDAWLDQNAIDPEMTAVTVELDGLRFPPNDLHQTLAQQLAVLEETRRMATTGVLAGADRERTAVLVGMGVDTEIVRYGARWRVAQWGRTLGRDDAWIAEARESFTELLGAHGVVGSMPNIPANRINSQLDLAGPSFTVSSEELSGLRALHVAQRWIEHGLVEAAVVGAVEMGCETVNRTAVDETFDDDRTPADAVVVLALRRLDDAEREGLPVLAVLDDEDEDAWSLDQSSIRECFGHAHAADGMLGVGCAVLSCRHGVRPGPRGAGPWMVDVPGDPRRARVELDALGGQRDAVGFRSHGEAVGLALEERPSIWFAHGDDRSAVIEALRVGDLVEEPERECRIAIVATASTLDDRVDEALSILEADRSWTDGIYYREGEIDGETAFVFTGSASPYPGMASDLVSHLPRLADAVAARLGADVRTGSQAEWVWEPGNPELATDPERQVWSASWISQIHAELSRNVLGLKADAAIGYSLGESNALFGLQAWNDLHEMLHDLPESKLFQEELAGDFAAIRSAWAADGDVEAATVDGTPWQNWTVLGPVENVRAAVDAEPRCHITIVNTDFECIIGGAPDACDRVLETLLDDPKTHAQRLPYHVAIHAPEVTEVSDAYRALHHRETKPVETRFYTNATNTHYRAEADACADALVGQATGTVEFPTTIRNAWDDGVRIFIEHGPRALCTGWIRRILGDREHLTLALDRPGADATRHVLNVAAQLRIAGVDVDWRGFVDALAERTSVELKRPLEFPAHRSPVELAPADDVFTLPRPPAAPEGVRTVSRPIRPAAPEPTRAVASTDAPPAPTSSVPAPPRASGSGTTALIGDALAFQNQVAQVHTAFLRRQAEVHADFMAAQQRGVQRLIDAAGSRNTLAQWPTPTHVPTPDSQPAPPPSRPPTRPAAAPAVQEPDVTDGSRATSRGQAVISREELEYMAHGEISRVLGPQFAPQDEYDLQVRMPMPPLLLADRVVELDAEPASMEPGRIVTETDVSEDSWYLHDGRMPAGVMIESGQADLLLVSYLGVDLLNKGKRCYRLLGCTLTYTGDLPTPGETLRYDIEIDGFAKHGDVRLFFFHYDCTVGDDVRLQVRHGQAGFFTYDELEESGGVLWSPEEGEHDPDAPVAPPAVRCTKSSFGPDELAAFAEHRPWECFGEGWEYARTHVRSPSIETGDMLLLDRVTDFDVEGGHWGKGYLRAEADITPDDWFFEGHFHKDPCMPGTLMLEAALQAMAFYLAGTGFTVRRDGWRFQPVQDIPYDMRCRGQIDPDSRDAVYEIFVEELDDGSDDGIPKLYADMLVTVDGLKAFHCRRMGLALVPDYPLGRIGDEPSSLPASDAQIRAIQRGWPSDAFGEMYERFDGPRSVPRLPGPPYDLMTRVIEASGRQSMEAGSHVVAEYDVPADAWYFDEGEQKMPYGVLLEAGLQPCGWLASWVGCTLNGDRDVFFRNLDGTATAHRAVVPDDSKLTTTATLNRVSRSGAMTIVGFDVAVRAGTDLVYEMETVFGFFPEEALAAQAGITDETPPELPSGVGTSIERRGMLGLLTRVIEKSADGGLHGDGRVVAQMDVDPGQWFFKAHFFTDPVQPGSLGLQLMLDALSLLGERAPGAAIGGGEDHEWKYRGQVRPWNETVTVDVHRRRSDDGSVMADGWLWVDGECIYRFRDFALAD